MEKITNFLYGLLGLAAIMLLFTVGILLLAALGIPDLVAPILEPLQKGLLAGIIIGIIVFIVQKAQKL